MKVNPESLPDLSKVLIYPAGRKFYPDELPEVSREIERFFEALTGVDYNFEIRYDRFIIIIISENTPLPDKAAEDLIALMQQFEKQYKLTLIDKVKVFFKQGDYVQVKEVPDFKKMIKNRSVSKKVIVFNNLIYSKAELDCCWEVPADQSWISHLF